MAPNPDGNGVILVGGSIYSSDDQAMHEIASILELNLKADGEGRWVGSWTTLKAKLQYPRSNHVVIPVFMDMNITCELNGRKSLHTTNGDDTNHINVINGR